LSSKPVSAPKGASPLPASPGAPTPGAFSHGAFAPHAAMPAGAPANAGPPNPPPPARRFVAPATPVQMPSRPNDPADAAQYDVPRGPRFDPPLPSAPTAKPATPDGNSRTPRFGQASSPAAPAAAAGARPAPAQPTPGAKSESGARGWRLPAAGAAADDPLLECLVVLTGLLERPHSAQALTAGLPLVDNRLTPPLFERAAARAGLSTRIVRRPLGEISDLSLPCVLLLKEQKACVLVSVKAGRVGVIMPEAGHGVADLALETLAQRYTGYAIFAKPEYRFDARSEATDLRPTRDWFWGTLSLYRRTYLWVAVAALLVNLFALALPLFTMNVYDRVVPTKGQETLWVFVIGVTAIFVVEFVLRFVRSYFVDEAGRSADELMAGRIFGQVLGIRLDARPQSAGAFANQLREFETLRDFFTSATLVTLIDLPFIALFIAVVYVIGGPVALVPLIAVPIVVGTGLLYQKRINRTVARSAREAAQKHALLVESIVGLETIKGLGAEGRTQRNWERFVAMTADSANETRRHSHTAQFVTNFVSQIVSIAVVIVGVYQIFEGNLTVGALIACTILTGRAMAPLTQVASLLTRFDQSMVSLRTIDKIMQMPVDRPPGTQFVHRPVLRGDIEFKDVKFRYPGQPVPALDGVSFRVKAGERVGIVGKIGSGKSTIEKLILNFYAPESGSIRIDGTDLKQIDPADLRRNIGYVPQDVFLFFGSVRDNIAIGQPHADDAAILRAARLAGVDAFVARHPSGFDMPVGEGGQSLSGGQRQSVAIARAFIREPNILIMDEPSSAMDKGSEDWLMARMEEILDGKTLLLVTQRLSLLSLVDRLIVMDNGRVVADGPRDAVLESLQKGQLRGLG
jgi:ATP-binding cassette, subfamily C, bacterial LapB